MSERRLGFIGPHGESSELFVLRSRVEAIRMGFGLTGRELYGQFGGAFSPVPEVYRGTQYRSVRQGFRWRAVYNRVVDDDGPSARPPFPWPFLADGSPNPLYCRAVVARSPEPLVQRLNDLAISEPQEAFLPTGQPSDATA